MRKVVLLVLAVTLVGCASSRQERVAAIQSEFPQLVEACNGWPAERAAGLIAWNTIEACERLALHNSLRLAEPDAARAYVRLRGQRFIDDLHLGRP